MHELVARSTRSVKTLSETKNQQRKQTEQPNTMNQRLLFRENGLLPNMQQHQNTTEKQKG